MTAGAASSTDAGKRLRQICLNLFEAVIRNDPECLAMFREAMQGISGRPSVESSYIVTTLKQQPTGNSRAYSIARVQSQCDANSEAQLWLRSELAGTQAVTVKQGQPKKESNVDHINIIRGGTGAPYLLRRLAKTEPAIVKRYQAGEFASVRAAALVRRIQWGTPVSSMGDTSAINGGHQCRHGGHRVQPFNACSWLLSKQTNEQAQTIKSAGARLRRALALIVREVCIEASALLSPMSWHEQHNQKRAMGHGRRCSGTTWHK